MEMEKHHDTCQILHLPLVTWKYQISKEAFHDWITGQLYMEDCWKRVEKTINKFSVCYSSAKVNTEVK